MEADWAAEIGAGLPVIEADWAGFVDLRSDPEAIGSLPEAAGSPALARALTALNRPESPLLTSKCDTWLLDAEELDPDEYDAGAGECLAGVAAYIDIIVQDPRLFASFAWHEGWAARVVAQLRRKAVSNGRADVMIRAAEHGGADGFGITLYAAGCGPDAPAAREAMSAVLEGAAVTMMEAAQSRASSSIG